MGRGVSSSIWGTRVGSGTQRIANKALGLGEEALAKGKGFFSAGNLGRMFGFYTAFRIAEFGVDLAEEEYIEGPKRAATLRLEKELKKTERLAQREILQRQEKTAEGIRATAERKRKTELTLLATDIALQQPPVPTVTGGISTPVNLAGVHAAQTAPSAISPAELEYYRRLSDGDPLNSLLTAGINFG